MYEIGRPAEKKRSWVGVIVVVLFIIVLGLLWVWWDSRKPEEIKNSTPITTKVEASTDAKQAITEPLYTFELPVDWKFSSYSTNGEINSAEWISTKDYGTARMVKIFYDRLPVSFPINKLLPVALVNDKLRAGQLSQECTTFTNPEQSAGNPKNTQSAYMAVWQEIDFLCDFAHRQNNIVGVGMEGAGTNVKLMAPDGKEHNFWFIYVDHTSRPDYQIFEDVLSSFKLR